jgi:hypothetical protein
MVYLGGVFEVNCIYLCGYGVYGIVVLIVDC